ncbi:amino-acid N-acetyltransferase [Candidatus Methylacidithermus pantelleriae]|uniref:amino-acid N-acetyltransferase n=1 Tax=Candidatus Methylacidithermus pantelleriae TaxID=2744239 RepID=A0A8J2BN23_9BACT|nr:amino-acid N-acetyltransferase [Candidatus Methylacidithermus pantelleriae]CAF0692007.1 N-acetylglutamate synthase [Candidatus Methylacidithermus pantelleriae]
MNLSHLRGILTYVPEFRDKTFVIALDGAVIAHENFSHVVLDLAVLRSLNIRVVVVHGIGWQLTQAAKQSHFTPSNIDGTGVTDRPTLELAIQVANHVTHQILEALTSCDLRACYANAITAYPYGILRGVDQEFTGKVEKVDVSFLRDLLSHQIIPVLPPLGFDGEGKTFRVNSDGVALAVAEALGATKIIFLCSYAGIERSGRLIRQLPVTEAESWLKKDRPTLEPHLRSKLEHAVRACRRGVSRVHIVDGRVNEALLTEVFSREGTGTMIYADEYESIRPANKKDVRVILDLIRESMEVEELAYRSREDVANRITDYYVFELDRTVVGCVALHSYPETGQGEIACLHVARGHENKGLGRKLVSFAENVARSRGLRQVFALSTQAYTFFQQKMGFREETPQILPESRRKRYEESGRKSKILVKDLTG